MSPGEFLRTVWPGDGIFCLATPFTTPEGAKLYAHRTFDNISDAVSFALGQRGGSDVFFAIHTLKEHRVWNPEKTNLKTGETGAFEIRTQRNAAAARCFFFDLDVGDDPRKYVSQAEALVDLRRFCAETHLPRPLVASSGGGLHVYWLIGEALSSTEWRVHASKLRQLSRHHGLKADPMRTTDTASVLRVVGTSNFKDRSNPREVTALVAGVPTPTEVFVKLVDDAVIRAGITPRPPVPIADSLLGSNTSSVEYDGPPVSFPALITACSQMRRMVAERRTLSEPEWYHALNIIRFTEDGHKAAHRLSRDYPGYDAGETDAKLTQLESKGIQPSSCLTVMEKCGDEACEGCPFLGKVKNPIMAARFKDPAPAPIVQQLVGATMVTTNIPDPPYPYTRMKGSGICVEIQKADQEKVSIIIYPYDIYPIRRLTNEAAGTEQQLWRVELPHAVTRDFLVDAEALYDSRKLAAVIANQGVYPSRGDLNHLQDYMIAYIAELQRAAEADAQCTHLGWSEDHASFVLPDKILLADGSARPALLSLGASRATLQVGAKGDLATQVALMGFYDHPAYLANQFYILAGLAAPLFFATGHHGVIVNASGDAGASKSTSLYTAASFWGQPELYPINGTNNGATVRGRNERVTILANLPVCVDEITHMPVKDAVDLAMSITQPGHRIRLDTSGIERGSIGSYKATIMLATANNSLHSLLSTDNTAGTAGSMRVFEIAFAANHVRQKFEADEYLHALKENFGHIGDAFITYVVQNLDAVVARVRAVMKEIDIAARIQSSERFWSATTACVLVAGEIANQLGLLPYGVPAIRDWAVTKQIPHMRGIVVEEYSDPLSILADYLEHINGNIIMVSKSQYGNLNMPHSPRGALLAHFDTTDKMMWVLKKGFKEYCVRIGANSLKILDDLHRGSIGASGEVIRVVANKHIRKTLGTGTDYAKAQSWCFAVNMAHPDVSGRVDLAVVTGGSGLRAVS